MKKYFGLLIVLSFLVFGISKAEATAIVAPAADSVSTTVSIGRTLNVGSSGEDVKVLQNILKQKGYLSAIATGNYGSLTKSAVKKYQKDAKLTTVSGLVDADTLAKIQSNIAKSVPPTPIFINDIESLPAASKPFIHIVGSSGGQVSDSSISVKMGSTFTVSGVPQNLHGLSYYFGTGSPTTGYFSRAYFFDQNFGDNNSCGNNEALADNTWVMTCTAKVMAQANFILRFMPMDKFINLIQLV